MEAEEKIRAKYRVLLPAMDERRRRLWAGAEAHALGRGGVALVARATGLARNTIVRGIADLEEKDLLSPTRVRRPGGGRKKATLPARELTTAPEELVEGLLQDLDERLQDSRKTMEGTIGLMKRNYRILRSGSQK